MSRLWGTVSASKQVGETTMPVSTHKPIAELHNLAAHAHTAAAAAHDKGDHLSAHELTKQAFEHSRNAFKLSETLAAESQKSSKKSA